MLTKDSLVYYWRTRIDNPLPGESVDWTTSSFVFIQNGAEGWAQVKFPQFTEDPAIGLAKDSQINRLKFLETVSTVDIKTFGSANPTPYSQVSLKINQEEFNVATQEAPCRNNSLNLIAFDKSSSAPYAGIPFASFFDQRACGRAPQMINNFLLSELETGHGDDLAQWMLNIKTSDSVVIYSIGDAGYASWSAGIKGQLAAIGLSSTQLNGVQPGEPFIIFGRKGSPAASAKIFRPAQAPANAQALTVNKTITGIYSQGSLASVTIGPALLWSQFTSKINSITADDIFGTDVVGVDLAGHETLLKTNLTNTTSLSDVDATQYPFMKLVFHTEDNLSLTPAQLRKWIVNYTPMAEGILTYAGTKQAETVQEGQAWTARYGFTNISSRNFLDSLVVQVDVFSTARHASQRQTFRIKQPSPSDTTKFSVTVNTLGKAGPNDITVFVNPRIQPESIYDNNLLALYGHLNVEADRTGPILEVTMDGRQVVDGDVVSASPVIVTTVMDHNPFLLKKDTTGVNIYLQYPCATTNCPYQRINFSRPDVTWKPATAEESFQVTFHPQGLVKGEYVLKAEAIDGSGNSSGSVPYEVNFVVTDKVAFTLQSVYPNPSRDKFNFKIFLSGPSDLDDFQLTVYSPTGSVVRSFGNEALELLHVGTSVITMGATDANGNDLPNGIYLFRIISSVGGKQFASSGRLMVVR